MYQNVQCVIVKNDATGLSSNLTGMKIPFLTDLPLLNAIMLSFKSIKCNNKLLLAWDKFMPGMHLIQPGFTYNVLGPFTKNNERIKKFKEKGDSIYIFIKTN